MFQVETLLKKDHKKFFSLIVLRLHAKFNKMELTLDEIKFLVRYEYVLGRSQVILNRVYF